MTLTKERIAEITWILLKRRARKKGISSFEPNKVKRELGNLEKATGVPYEELREVGKKLIGELVEEAFSKRKERKRRRQG